LELGGGWGHVGVMQPIAKQLIEEGHRVTAIVPNVKTAAQMLNADAGCVEYVKLLAAPAGNIAGGPKRPIRTFGDVLRATVFSDAASLAARAAAWQALFEHIKPDVLICDHAPTALLASRGMQVKRFVLGQGFTLPDAVEHFPDWRPALGPTNTLHDGEYAALDVVNTWLASRELPLLSRLSDLYREVDRHWLATLPELDCYAPRVRPVEYLGVWQASGSALPIWPDSPGKKVLAYLKPSPALATLLEQLRRLRAASLVVCPDLGPALAAKCEGKRGRIERKPIDLEAACRACDLAIGNGTHGFTAAALLAGKPQLMLPLELEQRLTAQRVQQLGGGLVANCRDGKDAVLELRKLWEGDYYPARAPEHHRKAEMGAFCYDQF
jgi:hypothetical protein